MIKVVLFDFGGVLTEGGKLGSIRAMFARAYGAEPEEVQLSKAVEDAFCGLITDEAFVEAVNRLNPAFPPITTDIFMGDTDGDFFIKCEPVYALAEQLRQQGITTGILSNVFGLSAAQLQQRGFYDGFEPLFLSYKMHKQKPDPAIYREAVDELGVDATQILFIDDKEDYLAPARALGMYTIVAQNPQQIVEDTKVLLMRQNNLHL